jgi:hypothetical protein
MNSEVLTYTAFTIQADGQTVDFGFTLQHAGENFDFSERLRFPIPLHHSYETESVLQSLHLALGISYYKLFMPPDIRHPYALNESGAAFWNQVWQNGLGEFLYVNKLSADNLARFSAQDGMQPGGEKSVTWETKALLGIGGGKDSIVGGELLKQAGIATEGFVMATGEQLGQTKDVAETMGINLHAVERRLDPQLIALTERPDAYKGHIPISLIFALVGSVLAVNRSAKYVVVANESSSSTPRLDWHGTAVNHQWSKSFEAEKLLQTYLQQTVSPELTYFSVIRPLNSIVIAKLFAKYPAYFEKFTSDNFVFRIDPAKRPHGRWGLESPKSLSSFILLAPWLEQDDLLRIFGRNYLEEESLEDLFLRLIGKKDHPPLDCVGTVDELKASLNSVLQQGRFLDAYLSTLVQSDDFIGPDKPIVGKFLDFETEEALPRTLRDTLLELMKQGIAA